MEKKRFDKICQGIGQGEHPHMEHLVTHQHGEAIGCSGDSFEVLTDQEKYQHWDRRNCDEEP